MADSGPSATQIAPCRKAVAGRSHSVLQLFMSIERLRAPVWVWIVLICFLFVVPAISLRGFHLEEGSVVAIARGALEDGQWLVPSHYGYRFIERPVLMSWLVAGIGELFGINHWTARIPTVLSLIGGAALVYGLVRTRAGALAALFAAVCLLVSPAILQRVITAEPDLMLSVLLFAAFVLWWTAAERVTLARWIAIGAVLGLAVLIKGPQPIAYFTIGVGTFLVLYRRWSQIPGFLLGNGIAGLIALAWYAAVYQPGDLHLWIDHSRIWTTRGVSEPFHFSFMKWAGDGAELLLRVALGWLPGLLLIVPWVAAAIRSGTKEGDDLLVALLFYALGATVILAVWPGARERYALPAVLAVAAMAGLIFERFRAERPALVNAALVLAIWLAAYQIILGWLVMPLVPDLFQKNRTAGRTIAAAIEAQPGTLYAIHDAVHMEADWDRNNNVLAYVPSRVRDIPIEELPSVPPPAWVIVPAEKVPQVRALRPDLQITLRAILHEDRVSHLIELRAK